MNEMTKTTQIDLSDDRLVAIAEDMVDDHNYIGALKMLNKLRPAAEPNLDALALYAEIFDDLCMYERSINGWFAFLDAADDTEDISDCYEGLAVSYMNLGVSHFAAYYYNKLLMESVVDDEYRQSIVKDFLSSEENPLKFAYPPEIADVSDIFAVGMDDMRQGKFDEAIAEFDKVDERNPKYLAARNYVAMCYIVSDRLDEAVSECNNILKRNPDDVQALTSLAACRTEAGETASALELAKKLITLDVTDHEDIYKIATVCCENDMPAEAYEAFCRLPEEVACDKNIMFFKAVSAYNCGKIQKCYDEFDKLLAVYPDAVVAQYFFARARELQEQESQEKLSYFYRMPQETRESSLKVLAAFMQLSKDTAKKFCEQVDLTQIIKWCFDEIEGAGSEELRRVATLAAVKAGLDDVLRKIFLNAFLADELKVEALTAVVERNRPDVFGVVLCNVYKRIYIEPIFVGRMRRKAFISAYARLVAHFSILNEGCTEAFVNAAHTLYDKLDECGKLALADDIDALAAAIYIKSRVREAGVKGRNIYAFFDVSPERVKAITEVK